MTKKKPEDYPKPDFSKMKSYGLSGEEMRIITIEESLGKPASIKGKSRDAFRKAVSEDIKKMKEYGIPIAIPQGD